MTVSALPTPPNRSQSPAAFSAAADALLGALPQFVSEINSTEININNKEVSATNSASAAAASAASASAASATASTSTTSLSIAVGTKNFAIQAGKNIVPGMFVTAAYDANNYMFGSVISYAGTALSINVIAVVGSGTYASWSIALSAPVTPLNNNFSGQVTIYGVQNGGTFTPLALVNGSGSAGSAVRISLDPGNNGVGIRDAQIVAINNGGNQITMAFLVSSAGAPYEAARFTPGGNFLLGMSADDGVSKFVSYGASAGNVVTAARLVNGSGAANSSVRISFDPGNNGAGFRDAQIVATNNGSNLVNIAFWVAFGSTPFEAVRIAATGNLLVGTTTDDGTNKLQVNGSASFNGVKHDVLTVNGVGSLRILKNVSAGTITSGSTAAGSALAGVYWTSGAALTATGAPVGTWKNITGGSIANGEFGEWVRIA